MLTAVGHEIRRYIPNAKDFQYTDVVMAERRIQAIDIDPVKKLVSAGRKRQTHAHAHLMRCVYVSVEGEDVHCKPEITAHNA